MADARLMDVGEIVALLEDRIEMLAGEIFPNARRDGRELCVGSLAGEPGQSLRINIGSGSKRGWWKDFASGEGGDALGLVQHALFAGDKGKAVRWSKGWLGLDDSDPARLEQRRVEARARAEQRDRARDEEEKKQIERARRRWHQAHRLERGDPVVRYLAERAIDLEALAEATGGRRPGAIRYHDRLHYGYGEDARVLPAMVTMATALSGEHRATHRTWLGCDRIAGEERWRKAGEAELGRNADGSARDPKKMMGRYLGCHMPIWKGEQNCALKDIARGTDVYVSEGVEDGLTVACADPSLRVIAMIAAGNAAALELPPQMGRLIFLKQNDPPGSDADRAMQRAVVHHRAEGRRVLFVAPPAGVKDLNDLARGAA